MDFNTINLKKDINGKIDKVFTIIESLKGNKNSLIKLASSELNKKINIKDDTINTNLTYKKAIASQEDDLDNGLDLEEEKITIVSKEIKDPNYEAYITKVAITKNGEKKAESLIKIITKVEIEIERKLSDKKVERLNSNLLSLREAILN